MNLPDVPFLALIRERMSWLNARQNLLSQNVANADTPGYTSRDLKKMDFEQLMRKAAGSELQSGMRTTNARHISLSPKGGPQSFTDYNAPDIESNPSGNTVSLESQMIKVADTQVQYQAAANLYSKAMGMMRTALGKPGY
jgi:flagellar basal-body rod protein FlgB